MATKKEIKQCKQIIAHYNKKAHKRHKAVNSKGQLTSDCRKEIIPKLREGYGVKQFNKIVDNMVPRWSHSIMMNRYIKPSTLFRPSHFMKYLHINEGSTVKYYSGNNNYHHNKEGFNNVTTEW